MCEHLSPFELPIDVLAVAGDVGRFGDLNPALEKFEFWGRRESHCHLAVSPACSPFTSETVSPANVSMPHKSLAGFPLKTLRLSQGQTSALHITVYWASSQVCS